MPPPAAAALIKALTLNGNGQKVTVQDTRGSGLLVPGGDVASHPQLMHCSFQAQLEGLRRIWCKKSSELCCSGVAFSSDTQQLEEGAVSVQQDRSTFNLTIWRLDQGEGTYWCGLLNLNNTVIKLAESYLRSPGELEAELLRGRQGHDAARADDDVDDTRLHCLSLSVPPQDPGNLWSLLRWVLMPLLPLVAATIHLCSSRCGACAGALLFIPLKYCRSHLGSPPLKSFNASSVLHITF
ncbi:hypothetical protein Z043_121859 [Scleropages formosus]|uniref:Immunoglobulin V-set domain-containing protein n=1 Tax=Scleropages formosus TaxID=113540 RepID=A0A0P7U0S4_SCLFO|nr:hypothetical protein Z043_121859 [Scleropages formosus]